MIKMMLSLISVVFLLGCSEFKSKDHPEKTPPEPMKYFPVASALISIHAQGDLASLNRKQTTIVKLLLPQAVAQAQASGVVSVTYNNPGATTFVLNTSNFMAGSYPQVVGNDLQLGDIAVSSLDDNSLRVCTGVGAPGNKCNRLYIRVFTLGSNIANTITNVAGFINVGGGYGIDVLAGSVLTPIGFNSNQNASSIVDAANVFTYTIPGNRNRVRLSDTGAISFPLKADLSNAGSGTYEMRLVVQYALGYVP